MRALRFHNLLPSTDELLKHALENEHRFEPVTGFEDSVLTKHEKKSAFEGLKFKDRIVRELISPAYDELFSRREEIRHAFNIKKLEWKEARIGFNSLGDGDTYIPHRDGGIVAGPNIELAFLLYFHSIPKQFSGGELVLHWKDGDEVIEPKDNLLVVFPGWLIHSINKVCVPSKEFSHRRFAVVGRVIGTPTPLQLLSKGISRIARTAVKLGNSIRAT